MNTPAEVDVLIVGGGPAGAMTALALRRLGLQVLLVADAQPGERAASVAESLSPALWASLRQSGMGGFADNAGIASACAGTKSLWHSAQPAFRDYFAEPAGAGLIVERGALDAHFLAQARAAGAGCQFGIRIGQAERHGKSVIVHGTRDGAGWTCRARFVVDATGKACTLARSLGARRQRITRQRATALHLAAATHAIEHQSMLWIEADRGGWWSAMTGPGGHRYLVRFCRNAQGPEARTDLAALLRASRMMGDMVGAEELAGLQPAILDAGCSALDQAAGDCWIAVGDAAIAFDPVSSQGLAHAHGSAGVAATAIHQLFTSGSADGLHDYVQRTELTLRHHLLQLRDHYLSQYRPSAAFAVPSESVCI